MDPALLQKKPGTLGSLPEAGDAKDRDEGTEEVASDAVGSHQKGLLSSANTLTSRDVPPQRHRRSPYLVASPAKLIWPMK